MTCSTGSCVRPCILPAAGLSTILFQVCNTYYGHSHAELHRHHDARTAFSLLRAQPQRQLGREGVHCAAQAGEALADIRQRLQGAAGAHGKKLRPRLQFKSVKPVGDRVFVKVEEPEARTMGGVLLPTTAQKRPTAGAIIALGDADTVKVGSLT